MACPAGQYPDNTLRGCAVPNCYPGSQPINGGCGRCPSGQFSPGGSTRQSHHPRCANVILTSLSLSQSAKSVQPVKFRPRTTRSAMLLTAPHRKASSQESDARIATMRLGSSPLAEPAYVSQSLLRCDASSSPLTVPSLKCASYARRIKRVQALALIVSICSAALVLLLSIPYVRNALLGALRQVASQVSEGQPYPSGTVLTL